MLERRYRRFRFVLSHLPYPNEKASEVGYFVVMQLFNTT